MPSIRSAAALLALAASTAVLAACGSDDTSSSSSSAASTTAAAASTTSASPSGLKDPGSRTIGVVRSSGTSENLAVWIAQLKAAAQPFGWKIDDCDGNGNPSTMESCAQAFVTRKVDAIVTMALGGLEIPNGLKQAKAAGIPVIAEGTSVNPGYDKVYDAVFADDIVKMGQVTGDYVAQHLKGQPIVGLSITQNYGGQGYVNGVKAGLARNGLKYDDLRDTNLADIVNSMKSNARAIVQKNSGKITFIGFNDIDPTLFESDFQKLGRDKDVTLITRYDDPSTVKIMRSGANVLISNSKDWQHIFDMLTALADHWVGGKPLPAPATTTNTPGAGVFSIKDFPSGSDRMFPFDPALKAQIGVWSKTYQLKPSTLKAP